MSLEIKIDRDIYEHGVYLYKTGAFTFEPGLTVLIGCNGSGKTTLLKQIKKKLSSDGKPFIFFQYDRERLERDNRLTQGDADAREFFSWVSCSEGEQIVVRLESLAYQIGEFVRENPGKDIFVLLDGVDSGFSIDNIIELKELLFKVIIKDFENKENDIYIICSANSYELAADEDCIVVCTGKHRRFKTYNTYRNMIMRTREIKGRRYKKGEK